MADEDEVDGGSPAERLAWAWKNVGRMAAYHEEQGGMLDREHDLARVIVDLGSRDERTMDVVLQVTARLVALEKQNADLKARLEALEAGQVHTEAADMARAIRAQQAQLDREPEGRP